MIIGPASDGIKMSEVLKEFVEPYRKFAETEEAYRKLLNGLPDLKIANIVDDFDLLVMARKNAFELVSQDPMLLKAEHKNIRHALLAKFGDALGLADVA